MWQLTDVYVRNACTAGYKAIYQDGTYPTAGFLAALDPDFAGFVTDKVERPIAQLGEHVGSLTAGAAAWTGLPAGIAVCAGNVDAHVSAPAANAVEPGQMVAIMGTSTCHVMSSDVLAEVPGMCGVVEGGIVPGLWGYEAGQSGVGDIFAWYVDNQLPSSYHDAAASAGVDVHEHLAHLAAGQPVGAHGLVALDWHSGNRSVLVDHDLSGVIVGLTLTTTPEEVYLALLESTAFGTRTIIEAFEASGIPVDEFVVVGGLLKNSFLMQLYADVINRPIGIITSDQGPALGSAIHAAVAAGAYPDIRVAAKAMGKLRRGAFTPDPHRAAMYDRLYAEYATLHDYFGRGRKRRDAPPASDAAGGVPMSDAVRVAREALCALHGELVRWGLVTWTSGNVSARIPGLDLMVIKPSGVAYHELTPDSMVVTDLHGEQVDGDLTPSSDTFSHAFIYREMPAVNGVVHTHSTYATAWAARGEAIPCVLTAMADEFGGEIPIARFARIGDDDIGMAVVSTLRGHRSPAVLLRNHGVFTVGRDRLGRRQGGRDVRGRGAHGAHRQAAR